MKKKLAALVLALVLLSVPANAFSDVDGGLYYAAPIAWAVEQGITTGTTEDTFSPDAFCTRGQIITFLWRTAGSPEPQSLESPYDDVTPDMNSDFYRAILWAGETGIIVSSNLNAGVFSPNAPCTRAATMDFLWRFAGSPAAGTPAAFTDVAPEANYAQAVAWAVEAGITEGTADNTFSPNEPCTRGQIAAFLYRCLNETGETAELPEEPVPSQPVYTVEEELRPQWVLTGQGRAYSLGLDGSDFTSDDIYEASASVEVYSAYEALFTIKVPFPLYQACNYTVRFNDPEQPEETCTFTFLRWDEAFADIIPWEGGENRLRFTDTSGESSAGSISWEDGGDDRIGGILVRWVSFSEGSGFSFDRLEGCTLTCEVSSSLQT